MQKTISSRCTHKDQDIANRTIVKLIDGPDMESLHFTKINKQIMQQFIIELLL